MAELWVTIQRQVYLRANLLASDSATAQDTAYNVANIGATQIGDRGIQFTDDSVNDAILNAADELVMRIGRNKYSPYRTFFAGVTSNVATGSTIPLVSSTSKSRIGVIGDVRDSSSNIKLKAKEYQEVIAVSSMTGLKQAVHWYYTDNVRIWHTRTNVVCDIVMWDKADQLALMVTNPTGACPFPQDLHQGLVYGALSNLFRATFNPEQSQVWRQRFDQVLDTLATIPIAREEVEERKLME